MRYSIIFAGTLATAASASPALFKRYYVTEYDYVTDVVTVTAGQQPAPTPSSEVSVAAVPTNNAWGNGHGWGNGQGWGNWFGGKPSSSYVAPAPVPTPTTTTTAAAAPVPTKVYQAPAPAKETPVKETPVKETPTKQSAPKTPASYGGGQPAYSDVVVMHHNLHRANHSAPDIEWDEGLANTALAIAQSCNYAHDVDKNGGGYGQNIAAGAPPENVSSIITDHFYNDEAGWFKPFYGEATPSDMSDETFDKFGHFTQIVWKGTKKVGCATYNCKGAGNGPQGLGLVAANVPPYFTVCNYSPPGNYLGKFSDNVAKPDGKPTENWSYGM